MARLPRLPGPRGTKVGRGGKTAKQRLRRMRAKRGAKDFGSRLLKSYGLGGSDFKKSSFIHSKLGLFDKPMWDKASKKEHDVPDLPVMETPKKVTNKSNPDLSSITKQLESLLKTASNLSLLTEKQQDELVKQVQQARRVAKEQAMESNVHAIAANDNELPGASITPLGDTVDKLAAALQKLTDIVESKVEEQEDQEPGFVQRLADMYGLGDWNKKRKAAGTKRPTLNEGFKAERTKTGKVRYRDAAGKFTTEAQAIKKPGILSRTASKVKGGLAAGVGKVANVVRGGVKATGAALAGTKLGGKLAGIIGRAASSSVVKKAAIKEVGAAAIKKLAAPILGKALGKTALKSIPIVGAIAGLGFAAKRLLEGDVVGAGLDAASGLAGPLTAIPALVASTARDVYTEAYGIPPEQDPMAGPRMAMVTGAVKSLAEGMVKDKVEPKDGTTAKPSAQAAAEPPKTPPAVPTEKPNVAATGGSGGGGGGAPSGGAAPAGNPPPAPATTPSEGGAAPAGAPPATEAQPPKSVAEQTPINIPSVQAAPEKPLTDTGAKIAAASVTNSDLAMSTGETQTVFPGTKVPMPANAPTTKNGAQGMGNVPDPNYTGMGDILKQLYFKAAA